MTSRSIALTSMLKILSELVINPIVSFAKIKFMQLCFRMFVFYDFFTKSIQNDQNLKFPAYPPHKMWEWHF